MNGKQKLACLILIGLAFAYVAPSHAGNKVAGFCQAACLAAIPSRSEPPKVVEPARPAVRHALPAAAEAVTVPVAPAVQPAAAKAPAAPVSSPCANGQCGRRRFFFK